MHAPAGINLYIYENPRRERAKESVIVMKLFIVAEAAHNGFDLLPSHYSSLAFSSWRATIVNFGQVNSLERGE